MKKCKAKGCNYFCWGGGYCKAHQYLRTDKKHIMRTRESLSKRRSKQKGYKIPLKSNNRLEDEKKYRQVCTEIDRDAKANNQFKCFFCDSQIEDKADHHHLKGRDGSLYTDKEFIVLAHRSCHSAYHDRPVEWLLQQDWYHGFLQRLLEKSKVLYRKEIIKQEKAGLI